MEYEPPSDQGNHKTVHNTAHNVNQSTSHNPATEDKRQRVRNPYRWENQEEAHKRRKIEQPRVDAVHRCDGNHRNFVAQ